MTIVLAPANIYDYDWLQSRIASWLHRTDLTATIPDFILLAEQRLNGDLEARLAQQSAALASIADEQPVALPDDVSTIRSLVMTDDEGGTLEYMGIEQFNARYSNDVSERPRSYTVVGTDLLLGPTPDAAYDLTLTYKARLAPLATYDTNWLIEGYPNAYLFASLIEAAKFIADDGRLPMWEASYAQAVKGINGDDWNIAGPMRIRSDVRH